MSYQEWRLHSIESREKLSFNKDEYSRFKYGSKSIARKFGKEMAPGIFLGLANGLDKSSQVVVAPSPYMFIPTATFALKDYLISNLNPLLISSGLKVVQETKVFRQTGYTSDYGSMTKEERSAVIGAESFHTDKEFLKDKCVLFLDDIKITGAHQDRMEEMIERMGLRNFCREIIFVYYAQLEDKTSDPTIEDHLNYFSMKSLLDLDKIIKNDEFFFNTRNVKYILNAPHIECVNFLEYQRRIFVETLYHWAIGNSYHLEEKFRMNFMYLEQIINKNHA